MDLRLLRRFWREALTLHGTILPRVTPLILSFGLFALLITMLVRFVDRQFHLRLTLATNPYEVAGAMLSLLLILRTNAGYERWWEARKLWGGIVNQSRNFTIDALSYGPDDPEWRRAIVGWTSAFAHVARCSLRGERPGPEVTALVGEEAAVRIAAADHMPGFVALTLGRLLREATDRHGMDRSAFLQADRERALLIDHIGGCERILKTPLPEAYAVMLRGFIVTFLLALPFALLDKVQYDWRIPVVSMLLAYPLTALDEIGEELQNPFALNHINHLPLDDIAATIERNLAGLVAERTAGGRGEEADLAAARRP
jgi:putative membrane protein